LIRKAQRSCRSRKGQRIEEEGVLFEEASKDKNREKKALIKYVKRSYTANANARKPVLSNRK